MAHDLHAYMDAEVIKLKYVTLFNRVFLIVFAYHKRYGTKNKIYQAPTTPAKID